MKTDTIINIIMKMTGRCKMVAMEDASRAVLTSASEQVVHAVNNTAT